MSSPTLSYLKSLNIAIQECPIPLLSDNASALINALFVNLSMA